MIRYFTLLLLLTSCSTFQAERPRKIQVERNWVVSTLSPNIYDGPRLNHLMSPIVTEDIVIQGNGLDGIATYERKSGRLIWKKHIQGGVQGAALHGNHLVFGGGDGGVFAVHAHSGKLLWSDRTGIEILTSPMIDGTWCYFLAGNNTVFAYNLKTGDRRWSYSRKDTTVISVNGGTTPASNGNFVIVGFSDGFLAAIRKIDGSLVWERELNLAPRFKDIDSNPIIDDGKIYVSSYDGNLYALNTSTGRVDWQLEDGGYSSALVNGNQLIYSTSNGEVRSVNKKTGKVLWTYKLKKGIATGVETFKEFIVFGTSNGPLIGIDSRTGKEKFHYIPGRGGLSKPGVFTEDNNVLMMSNEGNLHSIQITWQRDDMGWPWD